MLYPLFMATVGEESNNVQAGVIRAPGPMQCAYIHAGIGDVSQIQHHYMHANWFKIRTLTKIIKVHDVVSL
jgi:hypothetical protein